MIKVDSLSKKFGKTLAVDNISFQAKKGEVIGFLGPNGAGKTTTMRLLLGYLSPTSGRVSISGKNPMEERLAVLRLIGYLPENNPLYLGMKTIEYLRFVASIKEDKDWEEVALKVGLNDKLDIKIEELSRGYKQRVGLAAALLGKPRVLILDEPTSGLDPIEQEKIRQVIKKLGERKTVIFSTHILSEVEAVANRIIIIDKGRIVYDGKKPKSKGGVEKLFRKLVKS